MPKQFKEGLAFLALIEEHHMSYLKTPDTLALLSIILFITAIWKMSGSINSLAQGCWLAEERYV